MGSGLIVRATGSPARGAWSLHVAVFYNTKDMKQRKKAAVEYCKLLRQQGEEAYYHHGPVNSSVCIGAFPERALRNVKVEDPYSGVMNVKTKIVDERLLKLKEKYPVSLENGHKINQIQRGSDGKVEKRVALESFVVEIPKPGAALGGGGGVRRKAKSDSTASFCWPRVHDGQLSPVVVFRYSPFALRD